MPLYPFHARWSAVLTVVIGASCAHADEPGAPPMSLGQYLWKMGDQLDCYFTIEDRPIPGTQAFPWISGIKDFEPDLNIATIDALVAKLDQELEGVQVVRSTKHPSVVHLTAEDLLQQGYVMDQQVTTQYAGLLGELPNHLGTLLNGEIKTREWGSIQKARAGLFDDRTTEAVVDVQNEEVRDVLTGAVPLEGYSRVLWASGRYDPTEPTVYVRYTGRRLKPEDFISSLELYLLEMGKRLDCYFTIEDRPDPNPELHDLDPELPYLIYRGGFNPDVQIASIDALVQHLNAEFEDIHFVRSTAHPSVVHVIAEDLMQPGYVMTDTVTLNYEGDLEELPNAIGTMLNGRIVTGRLEDPPFDPGGYTRDVAVAAQNESVRNVLTGISLSEDYWRLLWQSVQVVEQGSPKVFVKFYGSAFKDGKLVDKDGNPLPGE